MFIARDKELSRFNSFMHSAKTALLIYGMRRTGKTCLIKKALETWSGKAIYYQCSQENYHVNLEALTGEYSIVFSDYHRHFDTFYDFFRFLAGLKEDIVVVLDEYSFLKESYGKNQTDSMMQKIIDSLYQSSVKVILCGSEVTVMKELLEHDNPLFDRFDMTIHLKPFDYFDSSLFFQNLQPKDKVLMYSLFGGLPAALREIKQDCSAAENVKSLLLAPEGRLRTLVEKTLLMEYQKPGSIYSLLSLIGNGKRTYSELRDRLDPRGTGNLSKLLSKLESNDSIKKLEPINRQGDARTAFYTISDNLLRFYFTYVYPNRGRIEMLGEDEVYRLFIEPSLDTWISYRFEEIARSYFSRRVRKVLKKNIFYIGLYYYNDKKTKTNGEFYCVLAHPEGYEIIEVKYLSGKMTEALAQEEEQKIRRIEEFRILGIGFVSIEEFGFNNPGCRLISGEDLFSDELK